MLDQIYKEIKMEAPVEETPVVASEVDTQALDQERQEAAEMGETAVSKLVMLADGTVATESEVNASMARGEEPSGAYSRGQR